MTRFFAASLVTLVIFFMAVFIDAACKNSTKQEVPPPPPAQVVPAPAPTPPAKEVPAPDIAEKKEDTVDSPLKDLGYGPKPAPDAGIAAKKVALPPIPAPLKKP